VPGAWGRTGAGGPGPGAVPWLGAGAISYTSNKKVNNNKAINRQFNGTVTAFN